MKLSAGLLLYRKRGDEPEVLLVHPGGPFWAKKDAGVWSIPKGEHSEGEDSYAAAQREFQEELGLPAPSGRPLELGAVKLNGGKRVTAWAVEGELEISRVKSNNFELEWPPRSGNQQSFPEIDRAEWLSLADASQKITPGQLPFLERLAEKLSIKANLKPPRQESLF